MDIQAHTIVDAFLSGWVSCFGICSTVTTGRGAQFESSLFQSLLSQLVVTRIRTTSYHPSSNEMVERIHRRLKTSLKCHNSPDWMGVLPLVLLGIRSSFKQDLGCCSALMLYGTPLYLPGEFFNYPPHSSSTAHSFLQTLSDHISKLMPCPPRSASSQKPFVHPDLNSSSHVFLWNDAVQRPLQQPYSGPCKVLKRFSKTLIIDYRGKRQCVSKDRLKPAYLANNEQDENMNDDFPKFSPSSSPPLPRHSVRKVHFPGYLKHFVVEGRGAL